MRAIILAWEYPPRIIGDLAWQVQAQVERLRGKGLRMEVVTIGDWGYYVEERAPGLRITWVANPVSPQSTIITWIMGINAEVARVVADIFHSEPESLIIHSYDWHFTPAASALKKALNIPWIASIYSLEQQRSLNPNSPLSSCIRTIEWQMSRECDVILVNNEWMLSELRRNLPLEREGVRVLDPSSAGWEEEVLRLYQSLVAR
ncbi:MAG: glycosyltransferase [Nitrososphaerota archaeon]|nr:glycosyltransferase [Candidatus Calditenuaceae archaeon]MDW8073287.1 glycosyltransferase [Nitrososphaerota archaeon]